MRFAFVIDQSRCIGCHACSLACKAEHDVPLGSYRTWVKYVEKGAFPNVRRTFSVLRCNHCDDAPCVEICPVTALFRRDDGIVDFDRDVCIGCKACMQACPYDALYIHPERGTAEKCNFCAHRVEIGLEPPCATVCPTESILVGDLDEPASRVAQLVATRKVDVRKPEKGTLPKVFYIEGEPRALTPGASDPSGGYLWADGPRAGLGGHDGLHAGHARTDATRIHWDSPESLDAVAAGPGAGDPSESVRSRSGALPVSAQSSPLGNGVATGGRATAAGPEAWMATDLPPAAAAQALAAAAMRGEADFFTGAWAGLTPARTVYDVGHAEHPWGAKVSAYLWTKSIAAGAFLVAALAPWLGIGNEPHLGLGLALVGLLFLALTGVLLVVDLKRPERFWTVLTRPNWSSWLARGAFIITAFGLLGGLWALLEALTLWSAAAPAGSAAAGSVAAGSAAVGSPATSFAPAGLGLLRWPLVAAAAAAAGYSGYLFAQARGRDFWQSPLLPLHLVVQAVAAGAATAALVALTVGAESGTLAALLVASLCLHLGLVAFGELSVAHATRDGARAARAMLRGRYAGWFWGGTALIVAATAAAAIVGVAGVVGIATALAALVGLAAYEHSWNLAGQAPPLS